MLIYYSNTSGQVVEMGLQRTQSRFCSVGILPTYITANGWGNKQQRRKILRLYNKTNRKIN